MSGSIAFAAALVLLCWPNAWLCGKRTRLLPIDTLLERPALIGTWLSSVAWWNLVRAWLGVWLLRHAETDFFGIAARHSVIVSYNGLVQALGLTLQIAFFRTRDDEVPVPVSYAFGILLAVLPPQISLPAIILGVTTAAAARSLVIGWVSAGLLVGALGFILALSKFQLAKMGLFFAVPLVWILGSNRHFVLPVISRGLTSTVGETAFASRLR